jgi:hypothetical protein
MSRSANTIVSTFATELGECAAIDDLKEVQACYDALKLKGYAEILDTAMSPVGLTLEVAAASSFVSGTTPGDEPQASRIAVWLAPSYRVDDGLEFAALFRWTQDRLIAEDPIAYDAGGRLTWRVTDELAISAEGVAREPGNSVSSYSNRWSALAEYRLPQGTLLYYSIGRDFKNATTGIAPVFARFGVAIGLGSSTVNVSR